MTISGILAEKRGAQFVSSGQKVRTLAASIATTDDALLSEWGRAVRSPAGVFVAWKMLAQASKTRILEARGNRLQNVSYHWLASEFS